jgi:hypothetical protein
VVGKLDYKIVGLAILFLLGWMGYSPLASRSTVEWSDNFDDEVLDGWTFFGYRDDGTGNWSVRVEEDHFSAEGGVLTVLDDDVNVARYNSTTSVGTWSFDMYIPDDDTGSIDVVFMSDGGRPGYDNPGGTGTVFSGNWVALEAYVEVGSFIFWYAEEGDASAFTYWDIEYHGWHYFNISRTSDGIFRLWHNGTLRALPVSNDVTSSDFLEVWCWNATGWAVDNIVVTDDPVTTITTPPPTTTTPPPTTNTTTTPPVDWLPIGIVGVSAVVIVVVLVIFLKRR